jgi:O-antigen/teichoic acid export membrane protein
MPTDPASVKARIFKNGIYSALSWVFPIIFAVIVTPIVVRGLGNDLYGLYVLILGFISYSFTFGIGKTAAKYVSEYKATGETNKISEAVSAVLWLSTGIGIAGAATVALTADYIVSNILLIPQALHYTAVVALYLASLTILVTMLSQVFQSVLQGLQRFDRFVFLTNVSVFLLNLGSVLIVVKGSGVTALLVWNLIVAALIGAAFYFNARRLLPEFTFCFSIKGEFWRASVKYGASIITYQVFSNALLLFERFLIVRRFGTEAVTYYVVPMMIGLYFHSFISSLVLVIFPVINEFLIDREKLTRLYQTSSKIIVTLTGFFLVTSVVTGRVFLTVWMGSEFAAYSYWILVCHVTTFCIVCVTIVVWQMNEGHRAAGSNAIVTIILLAVSAPLMYAFAERWQTTGIAFARLAGIVVFLPMIVVAEQRFLGGVLYRFWSNTLARLTIGVALTGFVEWLIVASFQPGWLVFLAAGLIGALVFAGVLVATGYLKDGEKAFLTDLFRSWRTSK